MVAGALEYFFTSRKIEKIKFELDNKQFGIFLTRGHRVNNNDFPHRPTTITKLHLQLSVKNCSKPQTHS